MYEKHLQANELIGIVNQALQVYYATPAEKYPQARAIDKLDDLTKFGADRLTAYKLLMQVIDGVIS